MIDTEREQYDAVDALNWSRLKELRKSPLHFSHACKVERRDTPSLKLGRAIHAAVFEPDRFDCEYLVFDGDRRTKAYKAFVAEHGDKTILSADEYVAATGTRDAVQAHPVSAKYLAEKAEAEKALVWTDSDTKIKCKARLDWVGPNVLVELKSARDISQHAFSSAMAQYGYHAQMAFQRHGLRELGLPTPIPIIIAVESHPPFDVGVFAIQDDTLWAGEILVRSLLRRHRNMDHDKPTGRYPGLTDLAIPSWAFPSDHEEE